MQPIDFLTSYLLDHNIPYKKLKDFDGKFYVEFNLPVVITFQGTTGSRFIVSDLEYSEVEHLEYSLRKWSGRKEA